MRPFNNAITQHMEQKKCIEDELFCLRYELSLLAGQVVGRSLERWIEGFTPVLIHHEHVQRYEFASKFAKGCKVLDAACGTGRGSRMLAENGFAAGVIGYDIEENAIHYAKIRNQHPNVCFNVANILQIKHRQEFDLAVCFETIEHVPTPELLISRLAAALRPGGLLLISTPISILEINPHPANPHHLQEWGCREFRRLLEKDFKVNKIHLQYWPIYKPTLQGRLIAKICSQLHIAGSSIRAVPSVLNWTTFDAESFHGLPFKLARLSQSAYQILECSLR